MSDAGRHIVWFRNDLRVADHPALYEALTSASGKVVGCFALSCAQWRAHDMGDVRIAFQLRALRSLSEELAGLGVPLKVLDVPRFDGVPDALAALCRELGAQAIHFIDEYPLNERRRDTAVSRRLSDDGVKVARYLGDAVIEPGRILTNEGEPYSVFTPFYRKWQKHLDQALERRIGRPDSQADPGVTGDRVPDRLDGVAGDLLEDLWPASEAAAHERLHRFIGGPIVDYADDRDRPDLTGTSSLSVYLATGVLSARQCVHAARRAAALDSKAQTGVDKWIGELGWRDFYRHVAALFDRVSCGHAFRTQMDELPWREAPQEFERWQHGETGYPLVDAAMRQLNATGWMHNRLRMVAAMFLTKHLLIDWRLGERYFMHKLIDGDFASNNGGWQWSASTGTDAAPYFRIFNPASQGKKCDPQGRFTRRYVPELEHVELQHLFEPGDRAAEGYPAPLVEHRFARERALAFFKANG